MRRSNQMEALQAILTRRSVRHFTEQAVSDDQIETLLRAGMHAPSAVNSQPWHFVVIRRKDTFESIMQFQPYAKCLKEAQAVILVCGEERLEKRPGRWVQDCSAATQNILLAAHATGLGAVWLGIQPVEERITAVADLAGLPEGVQPLAMVAVGYPAKQRDRKVDRFRPERIHIEHW